MFVGRWNADGTVDTGFGTGGILLLGAGTSGEDIAVLG